MLSKLFRLLVLFVAVMDPSVVFAGFIVDGAYIHGHGPLAKYAKYGHTQTLEPNPPARCGPYAHRHENYRDDNGDYSADYLRHHNFGNNDGNPLDGNQPLSIDSVPDLFSNQGTPTNQPPGSVPNLNPETPINQPSGNNPRINGNPLSPDEPPRNTDETRDATDIRSITLSHRLVLVITELEVIEGKIVRVIGCSNYPNSHVNGILKQKIGQNYFNVEVESDIYEKPVWDSETEMWVETCKEISLNIDLTELMLTASGGNSDIFEVELADGTWYRKYERVENELTLPYHNIIDGKRQEGWYQVQAAPASPYKRKLTGMWATLKQR